jgi:hypothetical protein
MEIQVHYRQLYIGIKNLTDVKVIPSASSDCDHKLLLAVFKETCCQKLREEM